MKVLTVFFFTCTVIFGGELCYASDADEIKEKFAAGIKYISSFTSKKKQNEYLLIEAHCEGEKSQCINETHYNIHEIKEQSNNVVILKGKIKYKKNKGVFKAKLKEIYGENIVQKICIGENYNFLMSSYPPLEEPTPSSTPSLGAMMAAMQCSI